MIQERRALLLVVPRRWRGKKMGKRENSCCVYYLRPFILLQPKQTGFWRGRLLAKFHFKNLVFMSLLLYSIFHCAGREREIDQMKLIQALNAPNNPRVAIFNSLSAATTTWSHFFVVTIVFLLQILLF